MPCTYGTIVREVPKHTLMPSHTCICEGTLLMKELRPRGVPMSLTISLAPRWRMDGMADSGGCAWLTTERRTPACDRR